MTDKLEACTVAAPTKTDQTWNEAIEAAAKVCEGANNYDNPMTAQDCADAIRALARPSQEPISGAVKIKFYLQRKGVLPDWVDETPGHSRLEDALACVRYSKSTKERPLRILEVGRRVIMDQAAIDAAPIQPSDDPPKLTDADIDRVLSTTIPGGSAARDWFLPHEHQRGLANVRDVVRHMIATALLHHREG